MFDRDLLKNKWKSAVFNRDKTSYCEGFRVFWSENSFWRFLHPFVTSVRRQDITSVIHSDWWVRWTCLLSPSTSTRVSFNHPQRLMGIVILYLFTASTRWIFILSIEVDGFNWIFFHIYRHYIDQVNIYIIHRGWWLQLNFFPHLYTLHRPG